ncbi:hypothetical protein ACWEOW_24115 [Monashia sp. NPDC004114]
MTWLSIVLVGLGVGDLVRASSWPPGRVVAHVATPVTMALVAVLAGVVGWADALALVLAAGGCALWLELSRDTQLTGRRALAPLATFGVVVAGLIAFSGAATPPGGPLATWLAWADLPAPTTPPTTPSAARVLLLAGLVMFNLATANVIVRLVLLAIGALRPEALTAAQRTPSSPPTQPADRLKGGRLLGPMERLVILGLGVAGELGAAGLVIAAKGLLRFPEIQAAARGSGPNAAGTASFPGGPVGIDDVTEYFLVGSFVSWLVALASLGLV